MGHPRILLIGLKHSGKSSVGAVLAVRLGYRFLDLDDEIVRVYRSSREGGAGNGGDRGADGSKETRAVPGPTAGPTVGRGVLPPTLDARRVYRSVGPDEFRRLEVLAAERIAWERDRAVIAAGGGTVENAAAMAALSPAFVVYLAVPIETLVRRVFSRGVPAFVDPVRPQEHFREICRNRIRACSNAAHLRIEAGDRSQEDIAREIALRIKESDIGGK